MDDAHAAETHDDGVEDHELEEHEIDEGEAEHDDPTGPKADAAPGKPVDIQQLAEVVLTMSRFVSKLTEAPTVKSEGLGLVEWLSLRQIAGTEGLRQNQLSNGLGVTRQRGNHITRSLRDGGFISIDTAEGAKGTKLVATDAGREKASAIDGAVMGLLAAKLDGKGGSLAQLRKRLTQMSKAIPATKSSGKKAKGAAAEGDPTGAVMPKPKGKGAGKGKKMGMGQGSKGPGKGMGKGKGAGKGMGKGKSAPPAEA